MEAMMDISSKEIEKFINSYIEAGFSQMSKHDVDLLIYKFFLENADSFKNLTCYDISKKLHISVSKVKKIKLDLFLRNDKTDTKKYIQEIIDDIKSENIKPELSKGKLQLIIDNPVSRHVLEHKIRNLGYVVDHSFNKDIFSMKLNSFLRAIEEILEKDKYCIFKKKFIKEINKLFKDDDKMMKEIKSEKNVKNLIDKIAKSPKTRVAIGLAQLIMRAVNC